MAARIIDRRNYDINVVEMDQYNRVLSDCIIYESGDWFGIFQNFFEDGRISKFESVSVFSKEEETFSRSDLREYQYFLDGSGRTVKSTVTNKRWNDNEPMEEHIDSFWHDEVLTIDGEYIPEEEADL